MCLYSPLDCGYSPKGCGGEFFFVNSFFASFFLSAFFFNSGDKGTAFLWFCCAQFAHFLFIVAKRRRIVVADS